MFSDKILRVFVFIIIFFQSISVLKPSEKFPPKIEDIEKNNIFDEDNDEDPENTSKLYHKLNNNMDNSLNLLNKYVKHLKNNIPSWGEKELNRSELDDIKNGEDLKKKLNVNEINLKDSSFKETDLSDPVDHKKDDKKEENNSICVECCKSFCG